MRRLLEAIRVFKQMKPLSEFLAFRVMGCELAEKKRRLYLYPGDLDPITRWPKKKVAKEPPMLTHHWLLKSSQ
jgi:hypothetical protein